MDPNSHQKMETGTGKYQPFGSVRFRLNLFLKSYGSVHDDSCSVHANSLFRIINHLNLAKHIFRAYKKGKGFL